ncbi:site-specific integrase, partial [Oscillibacter sp. CU971]|uniref:tyrosine-type recombinase/integrase n=1 Tax=Oscillibacter sp. CU971 TaxID=2780102 RepID=UPI00195997D6
IFSHLLSFGGIKSAFPKKNAQGAGTIRKRSDGRWEARFTVGFNPTTGKQVQKSIYGKTQKEVRERLTEVTMEVDTGTYAEPSKMTLEQWMGIWLDEYMFDKKWSAVKHYKAQVKINILPALGCYPLSQLDPHLIQTFYNSLLRGKGRTKPLSPKSIRNIHGILSKCLSTAVKLEYIRRNPAESVTLPRVDRKEIKPLNDGQVSKMVAQAGNDGFGTLFKVVVFTGLRLGEALGLTWDCVDFQKNRLTINKQLQKGRWRMSVLRLLR